MMDFTFEPTAWEQALSEIAEVDRISALRFLTILEGETEDVLEEALLQLELRRISLDIDQLPRYSGAGEAALRLRMEEKLVRQGDLLRDLEENDPLRLYLEEIAGLPATGDVQLMAQRFAGGYEAVLPGLTNRMLPLVIEMAKEMTGYGVLLLDLIQEGSLGLWQGILSYQSGDFESHARWWISQYLAKAVLMQARQSGLGQKMKEALEDYRSVDERLLAELGRNPTMEEMAEAMHITVQEAEAVAKMLDSARLLNRAHQENQEPEEEDPEDAQHVEDTALFQSRQRIADLMSDLSEQEHKVLSLRFGLEGGLPLSPEDTGKRLGLTAAEVVSIETVALSKMRNG